MVPDCCSEPKTLRVRPIDSCGVPAEPTSTAVEQVSGAAQAFVANDAKHPRRDGCCDAQSPDLAIQDDQGLLCGVFGIVSRRAQVLREAPHVWMSPIHDRGDRFPVATLGRCHELFTGPPTFHSPTSSTLRRGVWPLRWVSGPRGRRRGPSSRLNCHNHKSVPDRERIRTNER